MNLLTAMVIASMTIVCCEPCGCGLRIVGGGALPEAPGAVAFSEDGSKLACSARHRIYIWSVATGGLQQAIDVPARVGPVTWVPGQAQIAAGSSDGSIYLWNTKTWKPGQRISIDQGVIHHLAFSADGSRFLVACEAADPDVLTVALWDFHRREAVKTLVHEEQAFSGGIAFSPDQTTVAFGINLASGMSEVRRWHIGTGEWKGPLVLPEGMLKSVAYAPDGGQIAFGGWLSKANERAQGMVGRWSTTDAALVQADVFPQFSSIQAVFAPDGGSLVIGARSFHEREPVVSRWPLGGKRAEWEVRIDSEFINEIVFSPDGHLLAFSSSGTRKELGRLKLANPQTGEVTASLWPVHWVD
jgi:WD40 repeat protein